MEQDERRSNEMRKKCISEINELRREEFKGERERWADRREGERKASNSFK